MHMKGLAESLWIIVGCRRMRKCLQHRVAEQRSHAWAAARLIIQQCVRWAGQKHQVCARHRRITPGLALERRASHSSTRSASRYSQIHALYIGRAVGSGHMGRWHLPTKSVPWTLGQHAPKRGLLTAGCASRLWITKAHAPLWAHSANIKKSRNLQLQKHVAHLGRAGFSFCKLALLCAPVSRLTC